ncbi:lytic transglycosylase domain-containing protein [Rhodanobacter sp. 115]|uniref:lytic transglycosylase domain-containing protein n=1 Tax=Rhodanobacter sp. FW021-MT20 TaxID=1162282 RepID=UPI0034E54BC8
MIGVVWFTLAAPVCAAALRGRASPSHRYDACFASVGRYYGVNPFLLKAIAEKESRLNSRAIHRNSDGSVDVGLMQIDSFWFPRLASVGIAPSMLLTKPCLNVAVGAKILKGNLVQYGVTWTAIGAYNAKTPWKRKLYAAGVARNLVAELEAAQHAPAGD